MKSKITKILIYILTKIKWDYPCVIFNRLKWYTERIDGFEWECPFCKLDSKKILYQNKYRVVIKNLHPYYKTKKHLLLIPKRHVIKYKDLTDGEFLELKKLYSKYFEKWFVLFGRQYGFESDKFMISLHNDHASIGHLHIHFIKH